MVSGYRIEARRAEYDGPGERIGNAMRFAKLGNARRTVAARIRKARADGFLVTACERGKRWEIEGPYRTGEYAFCAHWLTITEI